MAIVHTNHVRQSTLTEYILQNFKYSVDWGIGDWGLSINSAIKRCIRIYAHSTNYYFLYEILRVPLQRSKLHVVFRRKWCSIN